MACTYDLPRWSSSNVPTLAILTIVAILTKVVFVKCPVAGTEPLAVLKFEKVTSKWPCICPHAYSYTLRTHADGAHTYTQVKANDMHRVHAHDTHL